MKLKSGIQKLYLALILIFLYAPVAVLIIYSFNESKSRANFTGFTFKWYFELFKDQQIMSAVATTFSIAFISSITATVIGTISAIGIDSLRKKQKKIIMWFNNIPLLNPDIVTGISLMILFVFMFNLLGFGKLGYTTLLISHILFNIPYVVLAVLPKLSQIDNNLYEAGLDLGATPSQTLIKVIIPEIMPAIISGLILAFTLSLDDFIISFFTTGNGVSNISILVYSMARRGINPKINALSTIMFVVVMSLMFLVNFMASRSKKPKKSLDFAKSE